LFNLGKKAFLKVTLRINKYKKEMPGIPLPPESIIIRETWLKAAFFYANNFEKFLIVIKSLKNNVDLY